MSIELKVKSKHLSEEARIIRFEENKVKKQADWYKQRQDSAKNRELMETWFSLNSHRRINVRNENRATYLARAYIAGKSYKTVEKNCKDSKFLEYYVLPRVVAMVAKYGDRAITKDQILNWLN